MSMAVELHAPSWLGLVVGVVVALVAIFFYFNPGVAHTNYAFWLMTIAYVVASLGTVVRT
jgi:multisubunit Na+/H+ antiporter MnhE subunit